MRLLRKKNVDKALYGLIGYPLEHSFSKKYFNDKFLHEGIQAKYENFPIADIADLPRVLIENPRLKGLNVTIPHKQAVLRYLQMVDRTAKLVDSVNTIKILNSGNSQKLIGYNTDVIGFSKTFDQIVSDRRSHYALILGNGGSAKAIKHVLRERGIFFRSVSTKKQKTDQITYDMLNKSMLEHFNVIINTTPLGMYPSIETAPSLPYDFIGPAHILIDLVYNPAETLFLRYGREKGAQTINGLVMLEAQAEAAWKIWKSGC